jgi:hypothetical protein
MTADGLAQAFLVAVGLGLFGLRAWNLRLRVDDPAPRGRRRVRRIRRLRTRHHSGAHSCTFEVDYH